MPKAHGKANVFAHRKSIQSYNLKKNVLAAFYRGWYVVVHLCSNFAVRRQMAPVQSIKFKTANFPIFCTRIIMIFWTTCIAREVFSLVIMGNLTHILPVLHWLEVVIAFVSSSCFNDSRLFCSVSTQVCCMSRLWVTSTQPSAILFLHFFVAFNPRDL